MSSFTLDIEKTPTLLARLSPIYGPGQSMGKQQGLLAHIARCTVRNQPIQIYVPLDTIRDYIAADDATEVMVAGLRWTGPQRRVLTKIVASEHPTTIAEIVSTFRKITRHAPKVVTSANQLRSLYSRRVQFEYVETPEGIPRSRTNLLIGIAQVMAAERAAFARAPD